ncbi:MAG: hypothetical protein JRG89_22875, partial [Deltaproteobacteria bacterium]|nr:hypothetical protein [Deltaproteobacteria bacterium]
HDLRIARMHTHIGSGSDPDKWVVCAKMSLAIAARLPEVHSLSLGGGFNVGRMANEDSADLLAIGQKIVPEVENFAREHGRELTLEIEPGTYVAATSGALVCTVTDLVETSSENGYREAQHVRRPASDHRGPGRRPTTGDGRLSGSRSLLRKR